MYQVVLSEQQLEALLPLVREIVKADSDASWAWTLHIPSPSIVAACALASYLPFLGWLAALVTAIAPDGQLALRTLAFGWIGEHS